jgi:hypothetical protein
MTKSFALALALGATVAATSMTAIPALAPLSPDGPLIVNLGDAERGTIVGSARRPDARSTATGIASGAVGR